MNETQWYCAKCDVEMIQKKVPTMFMKKIGFEQAFVCPECGIQFLSEDVVQRSISAKEVDAEGKME